MFDYKNNEDKYTYGVFLRCITEFQRQKDERNQFDLDIKIFGPLVYSEYFFHFSKFSYKLRPILCQYYKKCEKASIG
jgi:hypothetical protein